MNFLAHCLIGAQATEETDPALVAGGFLGDFVKGTIPAAMPEPLATGVRLHRRIDAYSNQHPRIRASCQRFPPALRRIAPILVDIICDHLLARRWSEFHSEPLNEFSRATYQQIADHDRWLPETGHRFLRYAREQDLFARYDDWFVTLGAMRSVTRRLGKHELGATLEVSTLPLLDALDEDFLAFFPDLVGHASLWVQQQPTGPAAGSQRS